MASGTAASVKLYATGLQRPRVLTVKIELMSACDYQTEVVADVAREPAVAKADTEPMNNSVNGCAGTSFAPKLACFGGMTMAPLLER